MKVYDNFHNDDPSESDMHSSYATCADAVAAAKAIVDKCLQSDYTSGQSAAEVYERYTSFGDDPSVIGPCPEPAFSAWDCARRGCGEMCNARARP